MRAVANAPAGPPVDPVDFDCRAGWLIDGLGGTPQKDLLLQVRAGRIIGMVSFREGRQDPAHHYLNYRDCTLIPPLVDAHVHLTMSGTGDAAIRERQLNYDYGEASRVIGGHLRAHFHWGVTGVRDGGDHHGHVLRFRNEEQIDPDGVFALRTPGKAWHQPNRYGRLIGRVPSGHESLPEEIIQAAQSGIDHVKLVQSGLNSLTHFGRQTAPQFEPHLLQRAVTAAHHAGVTVMVHANGQIAVRQALLAGCDSIEHGFFMGSDNLALMAERQITWVPTAITMEAYGRCLTRDPAKAAIARRTLEDQCCQMELAHRLGVPMAAGSDAGSLGVEHGTGVWQELGLLVRSGLSPAQAVQCATVNGARLLGGREGHTIQANQKASFLVLSGESQLVGQGMPRIVTRFMAPQARHST